MTSWIEKKRIYILVGICTWAGARDKREAVRRTWMRREQPGIECVFFSGGGREPGEEGSDIVFLDVPDGYNELPAKVFAFFQYALEHYDFDWLFKCDDDTYLELSRLETVIDSRYDLIGDMLVKIREAPSGGAGYFLSRSMVEKLARLEPRPVSGAEDLIVGEWVKRFGGTMKATPQLYMNNVYYPNGGNAQVSSHWCSPAILDAIETFWDRQPDAIYWGEHPNWRDEVWFYANGVFRRRASDCYGWWRWGQQGELILQWQIWGVDQLIWQADRFQYTGSQLSLTRREGEPSLIALNRPSGNEDNDKTGSQVPVLVHLNCGERKLPSWLNLDKPRYDMARPLPWNDNEVDAYFLEHGIEQLDAAQASAFWQEVFRTLKPGGILRMTVTDMVALVRDKTPAVVQYRKLAANRKGRRGSWMTASRQKSFWTRELLIGVLQELGFEVRLQVAGESEHEELRGLEEPGEGDIFSSAGLLVIEARKPWAMRTTHMRDKFRASHRGEYRQTKRRPYVAPHFILGHRTGNRLFQIAAVYAHALRHGFECCVPWRHSSETRKLRVWLGDAAGACQDGGYDGQIVYREPVFSYRPIPGKAMNGALEGFFQSEKYFCDVEEAIRHLFRPLVAPRKSRCAGVHIRLGDYLTRQDMYHSPDEAFLSRAIGELSPGIKELVVFSDMPERAYDLIRQIPEAGRLNISVDLHRTLEALREMTSMEELIMSCSSFSWWGAWLGDQERVWVQKRWFTGGIEDYQDIYRAKWELI